MGPPFPQLLPSPQKMRTSSSLSLSPFVVAKMLSQGPIYLKYTLGVYFPEEKLLGRGTSSDAFLTTVLATLQRSPQGKHLLDWLMLNAYELGIKTSLTEIVAVFSGCWRQDQNIVTFSKIMLENNQQICQSGHTRPTRSYMNPNYPNDNNATK